MKRLNPVVTLLFVITTAAFVASFSMAVEGQQAGARRLEGQQPAATAEGQPATLAAITEALTGFDNITNGHITQEEFDEALEEFAEQEGRSDGLGPVYNAQSCGECHQNPVVGGPAQIGELRAGHLNAFGQFVDAPGGSLINDRAVNGDIQERVPGAENVRTFRISLSTLGDGYVEAINSNTLVAIANAQPAGMRGQVIQVPVLEAPGNNRVGRFGWKNQHASLLSFSSDAYLNEMGITNRFNPAENTSLGVFVGFGSGHDDVPDNTPCTADPSLNCAEDPSEDINTFADFMRSTTAPPRDAVLAATADAQAGANIFNAIGCNICHTPAIVTAAPGTIINGGELVVDDALGNKRIRPFGDFLLHDIGTGDGIVQNGGQSTRNKVRTMPLWGVRTHSRHMHDGASLTFNEAILRHAGEAAGVTNNYRSLTNAQQMRLITFLKSL